MDPKGTAADRSQIQVSVPSEEVTPEARATAKKRLDQRDNMIPRIAIGVDDPRLFDIAPGRLPSGIFNGLNRVSQKGLTQAERVHADASGAAIGTEFGAPVALPGGPTSLAVLARVPHAK